MTSVADLLGVISLGCMTFITIIAVFWRYVLNSALPWPEEMTRYFFIIATYMGISIVMGKDEHLKMEVLVIILGKKGERILKFFYLGICYRKCMAWARRRSPSPFLYGSCGRE